MSFKLLRHSISKETKNGLHLFLAAVVFLYLYSPLLDHWLGFHTFARPHSHQHVDLDLLISVSTEDESSSEVDTIAHEAHEEGVLCLLDINAVPIALCFHIEANWFLSLAHDASLVFEPFTPYYLVSFVFLSSIKPPPRS